MCFKYKIIPDYQNDSLQCVLFDRLWSFFYPKVNIRKRFSIFAFWFRSQNNRELGLSAHFVRFTIVLIINQEPLKSFDNDIFSCQPCVSSKPHVYWSPESKSNRYLLLFYFYHSTWMNWCLTFWLIFSSN